MQTNRRTNCNKDSHKDKAINVSEIDSLRAKDYAERKDEIIAILRNAVADLAKDDWMFRRY